MATLMDRLVELRQERGLTQSEVAARLGTSQPVIARLEAGGRDPRLSTLERYARVLGVDLDLRATSSAGLVSSLAERIRARLVREAESPTTTFREVIQFIDDAADVDGVELRRALKREPLSTGDRRWDAVVASAVDWVSSVGGITPPRWTSAARWRLPKPGWVLSPHERLHGLIRDETPEEFARHGVYVDQASLVSV